MKTTAWTTVSTHQRPCTQNTVARMGNELSKWCMWLNYLLTLLMNDDDEMDDGIRRNDLRRRSIDSPVLTDPETPQGSFSLSPRKAIMTPRGPGQGRMVG